MIYGYARVSTAMQGRDGNSLEDQVTVLQKYGCQEIIREAFSGKTMGRPKFQALLEKLREGDTLVVCKLDRFARTAIEGVQTVHSLFERGVRVHILNMGLIENTLTGNLNGLSRSICWTLSMTIYRISTGLRTRPTI